MEKKLIYILNSYSKNSAQHFYQVVHLLETMADQGVDITLVIEKATDIPEVGNKIKIICQKDNGKIARVRELSKILRSLFDEGYRKVFVRITMPAAIIAINIAKKYGAEVYFWQSGDNLTYDKKQPILPRIKWYLTNYSLLVYIRDHVNFFVTGPESMADYYVKNLKVKREKVLVLYNDIDDKRFESVNEADQKALKEKLGIPIDKKVVLFVHRLTPVKRFSYQIPFLAESEDFRRANAILIVVGGGPEENIIYEEYKKSLFKDCIQLIGKVPNAEIMDYYKVADVFINPSYSEGFPRVVIEAMSSGLPVVATDVGGTRDIMGPEQKKFLVDKDDRTEFRNNVIYLLTHSEVRNKIILENKEHVKRYTTDSVSKMYIERIFK